MFCECNETFFVFLFWSSVIISLLFIYFNLDKFVLKTWISKRVFYFVGILSRVRDLFLQGCPYVFSPLNVRFKDIYELHKSPI